MSNMIEFQALLTQLQEKSADVLLDLTKHKYEPLDELHSLVKKKRQDLKMTQQEVADLADISITTYKSLETGGNYTKETLFAVLKVLGIQLCLKS